MTDRIRVLGDPKSRNTFVQMVDDHDLEYMDKLMAELEQQAGSNWCLVTVKVKDWNQDLTPGNCEGQKLESGPDALGGASGLRE